MDEVFGRSSSATETVALLAARSSKLRQALAQVREAGHAYPVIDGTLIPIDRVAADRPFYSGKHRKHGMNLQVIATPDGDIMWVSGPLPGAVHDLTAARIWGIVLPTTRGAGVADERGRESARPRHGQVEVGAPRLSSSRARQRAPMMGRRREASLCPGGPVRDRPVQSGPELMGGTSARQQPRAVIEDGQAGLISPDRTALAAGGAIDKICDLALDHRRSFGC